MIRDELVTDPTLAAGLRDDVAPPVLASAAEAALAPLRAEGVDLILEGFLAHHGTPRHLRADGAPHVLAGDFCYATGLVRVAEAGDVGVIALLAALVARSAGLVADGRRGALDALWRCVVHVIAASDRAAASARLADALTALDAGDDGPLTRLAAAAPVAPGLAEAFA